MKHLRMQLLNAATVQIRSSTLQGVSLLCFLHRMLIRNVHNSNLEFYSGCLFERDRQLMKLLCLNVLKTSLFRHIWVVTASPVVQA